tara:strand:- start:1579 stop:2232 length:654 start_codon:yes stop_codon:yes gene_type:complete
MATFKQQIFDITGDLSTSVSDASITQWLTSGARLVLNAMPIHKLERIASNTNFTNSQDTEGKRILSVLRKDANNSNRYMPCRELQPSQMGKVHDSSYMEFASTSDPAYIIHNQVINTFPESVASNDSRVVSINTDITVAHGVEVIDNFPDEAEYAVTLYAARQALKKLIADANNDEDVELASSYSNQYALVDAQYKEALQILGIEEIEERKLQRDAR